MKCGTKSPFSKDNAHFSFLFFPVRGEISSCRIFVVCSVMNNSYFDQKALTMKCVLGEISTHLRAGVMHMMES